MARGTNTGGTAAIEKPRAGKSEDGAESLQKSKPRTREEVQALLAAAEIGHSVVLSYHDEFRGLHDVPPNTCFQCSAKDAVSLTLTRVEPPPGPDGKAATIAAEAGRIESPKVNNSAGPRTGAAQSGPRPPVIGQDVFFFDISAESPLEPRAAKVTGKGTLPGCLHLTVYSNPQLDVARRLNSAVLTHTNVPWGYDGRPAIGTKRWCQSTTTVAIDALH